MSADDRPIGYYVHHHGHGHRVHAEALAAVLGPRLVGLGSGPAPEGWQDRWIALPRDDDDGPFGDDPTRAGAWHWLPRGHAGLTDRMRAIAGWITTAEPAALVSDVSCEVTALAALLGVPTAHVLLHGDRWDRPHRLAFDSADLLVAPWPEPPLGSGPERWAGKVRHLSLLSRFDGRPRPASGGDGSVLVLVPGGAHGFRAEAIEEAAVASGRHWVVAGEVEPVGRRRSAVTWHGQVADPWPLLGAASVVVAAAGAGSIGDIAAARRPAVLLPQPRPFGEQVTAAGGLVGRAPVHVLRSWPDLGWRTIIEDLAGRGGHGWASLHDGRGARRYADAVLELAAAGHGVRRGDGPVPDDVRA